MWNSIYPKFVECFENTSGEYAEVISFDGRL